jgi:hypothetical protein
MRPALPYLLHLVHHSQMGTGVADDEEPDLARWLEESGRRKVNPDWLAALYAQEAQSVAAPPRSKQPYVTQPTLLWLLGFAGFAYLQYFFIDVQLQVVSMRSLVVFIAT